ncbi:hypothetical protein [Enhygromyxa salina]|uniref:Uncharacterized protein n=1 Tax=Enhygromyxa salina TaxID=215803 RepID=A0A2S9YUB2_9BACT|nr:hypothetical protein [Enhygromyxa salina]PRQ08678.1 hypothetical protein ENSA7_16230 [Enhygromyxa salina]
MIARQQLDALRRELDQLFAAESAQARVLARPIAELARLVDQPVEPSPAELTPALDLLEDLLEALMREAGWPRAGSSGTTGRGSPC